MQAVLARQAVLGATMTIPCNKTEQLIGFDLDFTGLDCRNEIEPWDYDPKQPWVCPFKPGCGAKRASDCAAAKQFHQIHHAPERVQ